MTLLHSSSASVASASSSSSSSYSSSSASYSYSASSSPSSLFLQRLQKEIQAKRTTKNSSSRAPSGPGPRAFIERKDPIYDIINKVRGALPIVGLLSRLFSDDGGIGSDRIQFKEFCSLVYREFPSSDVPMAFYDFEGRHGTVARPQYVLFWCWAAAVGAGLLKSEDMMLAATRLRISFDIVYEEENFTILMDQATEKRKKSKSPVPFIPYEDRAEKALDGICKCCINKETIVDEEDARLLTIMLQGVFPGADKEEVEKIVQDKLARIKDGLDQSLENDQKENAQSSVISDSVAVDVGLAPSEVLGEGQSVVK